MPPLQEAIQTILHLDRQLAHLIHTYGVWTYAILFLILFAETGFVVTPFLPGDTLLFAAGIFSHPERHALNLWLVLLIMTAAPLCGDITNFLIGSWIGPHLFRNETSKFFRKDYLNKTHEFFEQYGPRTIVLARWVPIVRTFAPFVAGMGRMTFLEFIKSSVLAAFIWVWACVLGGYFFGQIPLVKHNFELAMLGLVLISLVPMSVHFIQSRIRKKRKG